MNPGLGDEHPSIGFYDSDYPSADGPLAEINFDGTVVNQGLAHDTVRVRELLGPAPLRVLDLCTGTGRIALPLARDGHRVTGVDISQAMLQRFAERLRDESPETRARITLLHQDITALDLAGPPFSAATIGFNSLLCIPDFRLQITALERIGAHLEPGAPLILDAMNPLVLPPGGDPQPKPFFTRVSTRTGKRYTRFAQMGPFDASQCQDLTGWYDEYDDDGTVRRHFYAMRWRPIFRFELELMLDKTGFDTVRVDGGHRGEPFEATSRKLFVVARRR